MAIGWSGEALGTSRLAARGCEEDRCLYLSLISLPKHFTMEDLTIHRFPVKVMFECHGTPTVGRVLTPVGRTMQVQHAGGMTWISEADITVEVPSVALAGGTAAARAVSHKEAAENVDVNSAATLLEPLLAAPLMLGDAILHLVAGSVLDFHGDAFVNAANEGCVGGFGIDEIVNQRGGPSLKEARKELGGCPTGEAKLTPAFAHTNTRHIVHAVGPVYRVNMVKHGFDGDGDRERSECYMRSLDPLLRDAYRAALRRAGECNATSIGFCLLSAGVFRGARPLATIVEIGLRVLVHALATRHECAAGLQHVTLCAYTEEERLVLRDLGVCVSRELAQGDAGAGGDLTKTLLEL